METKYKSEDLFESVESSFLFMASCLSFGSHFQRFGQSHVLPNLKNISMSDYFIAKEVQAHALKKGKLERVAISAALRGIFGSMNEVLKNNPTFRGKVDNILKESFRSFSDLIRLLRNVHSHDITWAATGDIVLKKEDIEGFIKYRKANGRPLIISFEFSYVEAFPELLVPQGYGLKLHVSLTELKEGKELSTIISLYSQLMLAELCYNMCTYLSSRKDGS